MGKQQKTKWMKRKLKRDGQNKANGNALSPHMMAHLKDLKPGSNVAVMTLLGSLCPITLSHVAAFVEGRRLLLGENATISRPTDLEDFDMVLGFVSLNSDEYLERKFQRQGDVPPLDYDERTELVRLAISDHDWMGVEDWEGCTRQQIEDEYPNLNIIHYYVNGADDVVKYAKWNFANDYARFLTMGRPGVTETLLKRVAQANNVNPAHFLIGPELQDISSTQAREALGRRDLSELNRLLCPKVIEWCLEQDPSKWQQQELEENSTAHKK